MLARTLVKVAPVTQVSTINTIRRQRVPAAGWEEGSVKEQTVVSLEGGAQRKKEGGRDGQREGWKADSSEAQTIHPSSADAWSEWHPLELKC
jgi:hypothetical protein